jgi:hypothetical protein
MSFSGFRHRKERLIAAAGNTKLALVASFSGWHEIVYGNGLESN